MLTTIIAFIIILGLLVFVHEMGHFLVARFFGVKAEEFGFGFPPRIFGVVFNEKKKKWELIKGSREVKRKNTVYSINWIPIGGFVKILGEDGEKKNEIKAKNKKEKKKKQKESGNFSHKPVWQRILILASGVLMNFFVAAIILSLGFMLGTPEPVENGQKAPNAKVQIIDVAAESPAKEAGVMPADELIKLSYGEESIEIQNEAQVKEFISNHLGEEILMEVKRGDDVYRFKMVPRKEHPKDQGAVGIAFSRIAIYKYPFHKSIHYGFISTGRMTVAILDAFGGMFGDLIFKGDSEKIKDVSGPIGIVVLTNQAKEMGFSYLIGFAAMLSINLAIINILPFPALDGGRIFFLIIEFFKGKPVSEKFESALHAAGMYFLLALMVFITFRDVFRFQDKFQILWEKMTGFF